MGPTAATVGARNPARADAAVLARFLAARGQEDQEEERRRDRGEGPFTFAEFLISYVDPLLALRRRDKAAPNTGVEGSAPLDDALSANFRPAGAQDGRGAPAGGAGESNTDSRRDFVYFAR